MNNYTLTGLNGAPSSDADAVSLFYFNSKFNHLDINKVLSNGVLG